MGTVEPVLEADASPAREDANAYEDHWYQVLRAAADRAASVAEGLGDEADHGDGWLRARA
jgi:hypothetical protein